MTMLTSEFRDGDGQDPRFDKKDRSSPKNRKALQLCAQVKQLLTLALAGSRDIILNGLTVLSVVPHPNSSVLMVTLDRGEFQDTDIYESLGRAYTWLRSEVAAGITRKKVPNLLFNTQ